VGDTFVHIDGVRIHECPVSYITPASKELLSQTLHARNLYRACGASLYGPDLSAWPAQAVDAMSAVESEHVAVENEIAEARTRAPSQ
jgi:hypothetical protein